MGTRNFTQFLGAQQTIQSHWSHRYAPETASVVLNIFGSIFAIFPVVYSKQYNMAAVIASHFTRKGEKSMKTVGIVFIIEIDNSL